MFGRATITLGIGPHSIVCVYFNILYFVYDIHNPTYMNTPDEFRNVSVTEADAARKADLNWKLLLSNNQSKMHGRLYNNVAKVVGANWTWGFLVNNKYLSYHRVTARRTSYFDSQNCEVEFLSHPLGG